jgi:hypothetical protein
MHPIANTESHSYDLNMDLFYRHNDEKSMSQNYGMITYTRCSKTYKFKLLVCDKTKDNKFKRAR